MLASWGGGRTESARAHLQRERWSQRPGAGVRGRGPQAATMRDGTAGTVPDDTAGTVPDDTAGTVPDDIPLPLRQRLSTREEDRGGNGKFDVHFKEHEETKRGLLISERLVNFSSVQFKNSFAFLLKQKLVTISRCTLCRAGDTGDAAP